MIGGKQRQRRTCDLNNKPKVHGNETNWPKMWQGSSSKNILGQGIGWQKIVGIFDLDW